MNTITKEKINQEAMGYLAIAISESCQSIYRSRGKITLQNIEHSLYSIIDNENSVFTKKFRESIKGLENEDKKEFLAKINEMVFHRIPEDGKWKIIGDVVILKK